jgi:hypothetical protein
MTHYKIETKRVTFTDSKGIFQIKYIKNLKLRK